MASLFVLLPSVRGIHPQTFWYCNDWRTELEKAGHYFCGGSVYRMPLDTARNELHTAFLRTTADVACWLDDDVQVDPGWIPKMLQAVLDGVDVLSAPCRLRDHTAGGSQETANLFNVTPVGLPIERSGLRLLKCQSTGLGCVMVSRRAMQKLHDACEPKYESRMSPGRKSAPIYRSEVIQANLVNPQASPNIHVYMQDDFVFSTLCLKAGIEIFCAGDVPTCHDGLPGTFFAAAEKLDKLRAAKAGKPLLGPDGRPV